MHCVLAPTVSLQHLVPKPIGLSGTVALTVGQFSDYVTALGIPRDLMDYVMRAFKDALDDEVRTVLNSTDLTNEFLLDLSTFTNRVVNFMIGLTQEVGLGLLLFLFVCFLHSFILFLPSLGFHCSLGRRFGLTQATPHTPALPLTRYSWILQRPYH